MQPELEKWIQEHRFPKDGNKRPEHQSFVIREADLRTLLEGKVIASAEPVAWLCKSADGLVDATASEFVRDDYARFKRDITPLYKAAGGGEG